MKIFTCRICEEVYIGATVPPSCPFCGVQNKYLVLAHSWKDENNIELTKISKKNLYTALDLELSNTAFYRCVAKKISNQEISKMFKGLSKVEHEHASVFKKILKLKQMPESRETCKDDIGKCLEESLEREKKATVFYARAAKEAIEPRLKDVFIAIMNTEKDHIALDNKMKAKFKQKI